MRTTPTTTEFFQTRQGHELKTTNVQTPEV